MDRNQYYIASDNNLLLDILKSEINFLKSSWQHMLGRPVVVVAIRDFHLGRYRSVLSVFLLVLDLNDF